MTNKHSTPSAHGKVLGAAVLTQSDADQFKIAADKYVATATETKASARAVLVSLGIVTPKGRLSKHYR